MGITDFWKKKNDFSAEGLGIDPTADSSSFNPDSFNSGQGQSRSSMDFRNDFQQSQSPSTISSMNGGMFGQQSQSSSGNELQKDLQMISLKLDSIKSELDAMNQRLKNLENIAEREQQPKNKKWY